MDLSIKLKKMLNISICDISLFIYISSLISHKLGFGFDAIYCRLTFIFMIIIFVGQFIYDLIIKNDKLILNKQFIFLILFWGFAILSSFWALDWRTSISDFNWNAPLQILCISIFLSYRIKNYEDFRTILNIILLSVIYMCGLVLIRCPIDAIYERRMGGYVGLHSNAFGRYISFASIISLYLYLSLRKKMYLLLLPIFLVLIILSGSRTSLLLFFAGCTGLILILSKSKVKILWIISVVVIIILIVQMTLTNPQLYKLVGWRIEGLLNLFNDGEIDDSTMGRLYFIQSAQELFKNNWMIGIGLDNFQYYQRIIGYKQATYSHSNHWELLSCLGIIGHFLYYFIYYYVIYKSIVNYKKLDNQNKFVMLLIILILIVDYIIISYIDVFCQILLSICYLGCYKNKYKNS